MLMKQVRYALIMVAGVSVAAAAMTRTESHKGPSGLEGRMALSVSATQTTAASSTPIVVSTSSSVAPRRVADVPEPASMLLLGGSLVFLAGVARRGLSRRA